MGYARNAECYIQHVDRSREAHGHQRTGEVTVTESDGRFIIKFDYLKEAVALMRPLPGARWSWGDHSWSVSTRFRKRVDEAVMQIERLIFEDADQREIIKAREEADQIALADRLDQEAIDHPIAAPAKWRVFALGGRWNVVSPYSANLVAKFKSIRGHKWSGNAWTFPAGARVELEAIIEALGASS